MIHTFMKLWEQPFRLVVGLMSGTSADGIDAVLTKITGCGLSTKVEQLGFYFLPFVYLYFFYKIKFTMEKERH